MSTIYIGADHAGYELKNALKTHLEQQGYDVKDYGAYTLDPEDDFPTILTPLALDLASAGDESIRGIVIGGSGQGEAMIANRFPGIRAAVYYGGSANPSDPTTKDTGLDIIRLSREHNDANILSLGARFLTLDQAIQAVQVWLDTSTSTDPKYSRRNAMLDNIE